MTGVVSNSVHLCRDRGSGGMVGFRRHHWFHPCYSILHRSRHQLLPERYSRLYYRKANDRTMHVVGKKKQMKR